MKIFQSGDLSCMRDVAKIGGKGIGLLSLMKAKYTIPTTYFVTLSGYDEYLRSNLKIDKQIFESIVSKIRDYIACIGSSHVILRSSASNEDGTTCSYAGQYRSFVISANALDESTNIQALLHEMLCRPLSLEYKVYCSDSNIIQYPNYFTILIQPYILSKWSGVMFTSDPILHNSEVIIEIVEGNNEKITSGTCVPAFVQIDTCNERVINYNPGQTDIILNDRMIMDMLWLAQAGKKMEQYFRTPQDIEWLFSDGFIFLQTRPITAL